MNQKELKFEAGPDGWKKERNQLVTFSTLKHLVRKRTVSNLYLTDGQEVHSKDDIERAHFDFYTKLYSKEQTDPQVQDELLSQ